MRDAYLLQLEFVAAESIRGLHFYHGIYGSAIIREMLRRHIPAELGQTDFLDKLGIFPIPVLNGITALYPGESTFVNLILPVEHKELFLAALRHISKSKGRELCFPAYSAMQPGRNIHLQGVECLLSHEVAFDRWVPFTSEHIRQEADACKDLAEVTLRFYTPLRLYRDSKSKERPYMDARYFDAHSFIRKLGESNDLLLTAGEVEGVTTLKQGLVWVDVYDGTKLLGGVQGAVKLSLPPSSRLMELLVRGQYKGLGKNRALGCGYYQVEQSSLNPLAQVPPQAACLLSRLADRQFLLSLLNEMDSVTTGTDCISIQDLKNNEDQYLSALQHSLVAGEYRLAECKKISLVKEDGSYRELEINTIPDRHMLLGVERVINTACEELIPPYVYAYRHGKSYMDAAYAVHSGMKYGFGAGIRADISDFFGSVDNELLMLILSGMLGKDPVYPLLQQIITHHPQGLSQGSPLSPLLSNLYLLPFDREVGKTGYHYVRYADDFILLDKQAQDSEALLNIARNALSLVGLNISEQKTVRFAQDAVVEYCGCQVSAAGVSKIKPIPMPQEQTESTAHPAFLPNLEKGIPVYVTFRQSTVRSSETELIIETEADTRHISWSMISRLVIIGKPRISGNAIYKCMCLGKPVTFLTVTGHPTGAFLPERRMWKPQELCRDAKQDYDKVCIGFVRELVKAKLHNQDMVLRSNQVLISDFEELSNKADSLEDIEALRGIEGAAGAVYWKHFAALLSPFDMPSRTYHPSPDPVNAMLSLGYTILYYIMADALSTAGISPWDGIFHQKHDLHFALASDMIEPFRFLVDRIVLALIHNRQICSDDFIITEGAHGKYCRLQSEGFRKYIQRFEKTMHDTITAPHGEVVTWAVTLDSAARELINSLRLGISYTPYRLARY